LDVYTLFYTNFVYWLEKDEIVEEKNVIVGGENLILNQRICGFWSRSPERLVSRVLNGLAHRDLKGVPF
jgi:hypothetical protein